MYNRLIIFATFFLRIIIGILFCFFHNLEHKNFYRENSQLENQAQVNFAIRACNREAKFVDSDQTRSQNSFQEGQRRVYRCAIRNSRQKFFASCLFYFTVHRSRENLRNPSTFTYIIILVSSSRAACRVSVNAP